jgi:3-hydroxyisobutyrate dehydrogenase
MSRIALIGVGRMGLPICARLVRAGHTVLAVDVQPERARAAAATGALTGRSAQAATDQAQFVLTVMPGGPELDGLMRGDDGLAPRLAAGQTWIDLTSTSPQLGRALAATAAARGAGILEAPLGGGVDAARDGTLTLFVGGDPAVLESSRPVLEALARPERILHLGGIGTGRLAKLLVNLLWFGQALAVGEAMLLAQADGLDLPLLRQVLLEGPAGSEFIRATLPALFAGDYLTTFGLDRCVEELQSLRTLAGTHGLPFELSTLVADLHERALDLFGPVDGELMGVARLESQAGRLVRPAGNRREGG